MAKAPGGQLDSWKEIATYIRRDTRTAMRWAAHGMPVHHVPGSPRGRVFAYAAEIDAWLGGGFVPPENGAENHAAEPALHAEPSPARPWTRSALVQACLATVILGCLAGGLGWAVWRRHGATPASIQIQERGFVVADDAGRQIWEKTYPFPLAVDEYRQNVVFPKPDLALLDDIDADGKTEALFVPFPTRHPELAADRRLSCFGQGGTLKWEYARSKSVMFGGTVFDPPFVVQFFRVTSLAGEKSKDLWVVSTHQRWFPSVVTKLSSRGEVLAEYWHPGHVHVLAQANLFGRPVMAVGATNNETYSADLTILDYQRPEGHSPATTEPYQCTGCPPGRPFAFLTFPRTEVSKVLNTRPFVKEIWLLPEGGIEVHVLEGEHTDPGATVSYSFDSQLHLRNAEVTDGYVFSFDKMLAQGVLKHPLDRKAEADKLRHVRYWDGHAFSEEWQPALLAQNK